MKTKTIFKGLLFLMLVFLMVACPSPTSSSHTEETPVDNTNTDGNTDGNTGGNTDGNTDGNTGGNNGGTEPAIPTHNIIYNSNKPAGSSDSITGTVANTVLEEGGEITLTSSVYSLAGYTQTGWSLNADGSGTIPSTMGTSDITVYAQWEEATYTVTYSNIIPFWGTATDITHDPQSYSLSSPATVLDAATKLGYTWVSWNTKDDFTGKVYQPGDTIDYTMGDVTLYPHMTAGSTNGIKNETGYSYDFSTDETDPNDKKIILSNLNVTGSNVDVVIPAFIGGFPVKEIPDVFMFDSTDDTKFDGVVSVEIPFTVETIGVESFREASNLSSVTFKYNDDGLNNLTTIGDTAFAYTSITSLDIPDTVTTIDMYAFYRCYDLISVNIPTSLSTLQHSAFKDTTSLVNVTYTGDTTDNIIDFPSNITSLSHSLFDHSGLTGILELGSHIEEIGNNTFSYTDVSTVNFINSNTVIGNSAFAYCPNLSSVSLPANLTAIPNRLFQMSGTGEDNFDISIPAGVTSIGERAFQLSGIRNIAFEGTSLASIGSNSFSATSKLDYIRLPEGLTTIDIQAFYQSAIMTFDLPSTLNSIGDFAFAKTATTQGVTFIVRTKTPMSTAQGADLFDNISQGILYYPDNPSDPSDTAVSGFGYIDFPSNLRQPISALDS